MPSSQYTGTFSELLEKAGLSIVVTTYQAKKLAILRAQGNEINTHFIKMERPMGLAYKDGRLSVGSGNMVIDYFNSKNAAAKIEHSLPHDGVFLHRRTHVTGDIDIHEMAFTDHNDLWIVNTKMSCLCTLDVNYSFIPMWKPPFITDYDATDRCHLNGLAMRSGKPQYVTALGTSNEAAGWRSNKAFGGIVMDIEDNRVMARGLSMPHSPRWHQGKLWVLESGAGQLVTIDIETGEKTVVAEVPGFCRGLDFIGRYAVVGLSQIRETAMFAGLPLTRRKEDRQCGVWIVDLVAGETAGYLSFDTEIQEIFSVQCLPMKHPTLLGFDDKLLDTSYSVPASVIQSFMPAKPLQIKSDQAREFLRQGDYDKAIVLYQDILEHSPNSVDALYNLGHALSNIGHWDKAIAYIDRVISSHDDHAQAWNTRGHYYASMWEFHKAIDNYDKAISIDQQYVSAHYHKACAQLSQGDYKSGLAGYEWRTSMTGFKRISLPHPKWQGEDISDKSLLIVVDTKVEDAILFARYLAYAKEKCRRLIIVCDEPLRLLFNELDCIDEVRQHGKLPIDLFDVYTLIGSLGAILANEVGVIPNNGPYLKVGEKRGVRVLDENKHLQSNRCKVGIVWSCSQRKKSRPGFVLEDFLVVTDISDTDFYSFQQGALKEECEILNDHNFTNLESDLTSYYQTTAFLEKMDFMICVPSVIAHLAGALNVPTVVVTQNGADWRWADQTPTNTWYPSTKVLRLESTESTEKILRQCKNLMISGIDERHKGPAHN